MKLAQEVNEKIDKSKGGITLTCQECDHKFKSNISKGKEVKCPKCKSTDVDVD